APARPDQAGVVTTEFLRDVYAVLREVNEFVIIDTPPSFTPEVIAAVDSSTEVCISRDDVAAIMGAEPQVLVPSDRNVTRSINRGQPIVIESRRSEAAKAF